ncbi:MAG: VOC family protein [Acidobacteriota bacterium]|nr:VOC family protein [Acidobacteriota bacterium]
MAVNYIPEGYANVIPYIVVPGIAKLIDFMKAVFDAEETERMAQPDGTIMHAQVKIGGSVLMMGEPQGEFGPMPAQLYIYVCDTDETYRRAIKAGAASLMEPADQFYGDRNAGIKDPCGNNWWIATHQEEVSPEELQTRAAAYRR